MDEKSGRIRARHDLHPSAPGPTLGAGSGQYASEENSVLRFTRRSPEHMVRSDVINVNQTVLTFLGIVQVA